ncbi:DUF4176 domain-containing protein [Paenibacillus turpanensis]|uniref:DUF4176 domain-containing protein n=1 Tax=Paenibacillus turpanensis TaxID=2689078 RepID=UPI00140B2F19|nr:DUF4176 domain-containing protein [Paenibacillus turpanensis]
MKSIEHLLPIGSIVLLREGTKKLMIIGRFQKLLSSAETYDYIGCLYPEGYLKPDQNYVFNHDAIAEVVHEGYSNEEEQAFLSAVQEKLSSNEEK